MRSYRKCNHGFQKNYTNHRKPKTGRAYEECLNLIRDDAPHSVIADKLTGLSYDELGYISVNIMGSRKIIKEGDKYLLLRQYCSALRELKRAEDKIQTLEKELFNH